MRVFCALSSPKDNDMALPWSITVVNGPQPENREYLLQTALSLLSAEA